MSIKYWELGVRSQRNVQTRLGDTYFYDNTVLYIIYIMRFRVVDSLLLRASFGIDAIPFMSVLLDIVYV